MNKLYILLIYTTLVISNYIQCQVFESEFNPTSEKEFIQAKSFEEAGLYNEAIILYKKINRQNPGNIKYFKPLKKLFKESESWDTLLVYTEIFSKHQNENFDNKIELIDIYSILEMENKWKQLVNKIFSERLLDHKYIKKTIQQLIRIGQFEYAYSKLKDYRIETGKADFYSIELGSYLSMRMAFEKATYEYLLFLSNNPHSIQLISNKIMSFPNEPSINNTIKSILSNSSINASKIILADLHFKLREFDIAYSLLKQNDVSDKILFDFATDLSSIGEHSTAEIILTEIIKGSNDKKLITQSIFEIAKTFEKQIIESTIEMPISGFYKNNLFFSSPFKSFKEKSGSTLQQAIAIYDSLIVTNQNSQAAYRLAEVQYKILSDLDAALYLYEQTYQHANSKNLLIDAGVGIINILIGKGDLDLAKKKCMKLIKENPNIFIFKIKYSQILFYQGSFNEASKELKDLTQNLEINDPNFNDILEVLSIMSIFNENQSEFTTFSKAQHNLQQNKRIGALKNLESILNSDKEIIADMCKYQSAWLYYLQGDLSNSKKQLNSIKNNTIYKELSHIFNAEILDYIENDISKAIDNYLKFLDLYPQSIYYDDIRLRLRKLAS